jgi:hypothetical protein
MLTEYGALLLRLMAERDLVSYEGMAALLVAAGYDYRPEDVAAHVKGTIEEPDERFTRAIAEVMGLDREERRKLGAAFLFGNRRLGGVNPRGQDEAALP